MTRKPIALRLLTAAALLVAAAAFAAAWALGDQHGDDVFHLPRDHR